MPYDEDKLLPISALQHLVYCKRQCALIHIEQVWSENSLTAEGQILHKKTNTAADETLSGNRIARSMDLVSRRLGLVGISDVVEFTAPAGSSPYRALQTALHSDAPDRFKNWVITPVEYKRGKPKTSKVWGDCDRVQLCAQALCIEEMLGVYIPSGQLFYGAERRRLDVTFDEALRSRTQSLAKELHELLYQPVLPLPVNDNRCKRCSLIELCMPKQTHSSKLASQWLTRKLKSQLEAGSNDSI